MTKQMQSFINQYERATMTNISQLYNNASSYKWRAQQNILNLMHTKDHGYDYKVIGGNCMTFSCAYKFMKDGIEYLKYFTAWNTYEIPLI